MDPNIFYENLKAKVKAMKSSGQRGCKKDDIDYIENSGLRRATYCRRGNSLVLAAMEIELQTHCRVGVIMHPTWFNGKIHKYKTSLDLDTIPEDEEITPSTSITIMQENQPPTPRPTEPAAVDSPMLQRHPVVRVKTLVSLKPKRSKNQECRLCGDPEETSFFFGCGFRNPKSRKQDCSYWVHQHCIGLYFNKRTDLAKLPFYCKKHAPTKSKK